MFLNYFIYTTTVERPITFLINSRLMIIINKLIIKPNIFRAVFMRNLLKKIIDAYKTD